MPSQSARQNATNSELDAKKIVTHSGLTSAQKDELIEQYVELIIDGMEVKDLELYVTNDITEFLERLTDRELKDEISLTMDEEIYDELVDNVTNTDPIVYNTNREVKWEWFELLMMSYMTSLSYMIS